MKRNQITIIATIVMALLLAVSCSQKAVDGLGTVRLTNELSTHTIQPCQRAMRYGGSSTLRR